MSVYEEEHEIFRNSFRTFVEKEVSPHIEEWEEKRELPRSLWKKFGEQGYLCTWVDEQYGGSGVGFEYSVIMAKELGKVGAGMGIVTHSDILAPYIANYGTEDQKERWLPGCTSGDIILAIAMTEPNAGSDLQGIRTSAVKDGDDYVVNGQKTFITNGICADLVILASRTEAGISLMGVEDGTPGFVKGRKLEKMGLRHQDTAELFFDNCRVPKANIIGEEGKGFKILMGELQRERIMTTIMTQSMSERMLGDTMEYAKTREAFGRPIGNFQHNAFKIAEMATEVELGRTFLDRLIEEYMEGKDIITRVSMAKWWIAEMTNRIAYNCLQLHGGYGYMEEYPIARFFRDARSQTIPAGTTEIMKLIISRNMG
ncbi:MAG: acyl-CoA dehydrogenase family protein, partial [Desulfatiglans sp.]|nr:acyl-CoA dehydrogenase family protein [Desulfatiglans sp.]